MADSGFHDLDYLKTGIMELYESRAYPLDILQIRMCNAESGIPFTHAFCETKLIEDNIFAFGTIFSPGFKILANYFDTKALPECEHQRTALEKLLAFLSNKESLEFLVSEKKQSLLTTELSLGLAMAEHVLSKLAFNADYRLDWHYTNKARTCPCGCETEVDRVKHYGSNVIGHSRTWRGNLDIVMGKVGVCVEVDKPLPGSPGGPSTEMKLSKGFDDYGVKNQMLAQTIVFSFYQRKRHADDFNNFLVPCIGISKRKVVFYFYDSVEDVLVQTRPASLVVHGKIQYPILVALWLVLNYKILGGGLSEQMKNGPKSNFHKLVKNSLKLYEEDIEFGYDFPCGDQSNATDHEEEPFYSKFVMVPNENKINWSKVFENKSSVE